MALSNKGSMVRPFGWHPRLGRVRLALVACDDPNTLHNQGRGGSWAFPRNSRTSASMVAELFWARWNMFYNVTGHAAGSAGLQRSTMVCGGEVRGGHVHACMSLAQQEVVWCGGYGGCHQRRRSGGDGLAKANKRVQWAEKDRATRGLFVFRIRQPRQARGATEARGCSRGQSTWRRLPPQRQWGMTRRAKS